MAEIRKMEVSDLSEVMEVDALSLPAPWTFGVWRAEIESPLGLHLVAEGNGGIIGQVGAKVVLDELHVTTVAVRPESRRRGIAKALVLAAISEAPSARRVVLEVRESNAGARAFYRDLGFAESGVRPRYYGDEDAFVMTLDITAR